MMDSTANVMSSIFIYQNPQQNEMTTIALPVLAVTAIVIPILVCVVMTVAYIGMRVWRNRQRKKLLTIIIAKRKTYLKLTSPGMMSSIDDILSDPSLLEMFSHRCKTSHNEECLMFILSVSNYREMEGKEKEVEWTKLYDTYICKNSKYELNIPDKWRESLPQIRCWMRYTSK